MCTDKRQLSIQKNRGECKPVLPQETARLARLVIPGSLETMRFDDSS